MDRLAQKIRSSPVDLLLHSASEIDDELHDDAKTEIKAQFTENQINKVEMQAQLVHYYFYLLGKKHFSVVANGATAAELADEAVEGSPYNDEPNVSGGVLKGDSKCLNKILMNLHDSYTDRKPLIFDFQRRDKIPPDRACPDEM